MNNTVVSHAAFAGIAALLATASVSAAELKVLASNGVRAALEELAPAFERDTGNKLVISFGLAAALKRRIEAGEGFDLAILTSAGIEDLHRLPCRRRRGLEGLVGGKGADQVPHHAVRRRRVQGEGAGAGLK